MEERGDDELLAAARRGSREAFEQFYRRHVRSVLAYFASRVRERETAADLTAETFAAALAGIRRFDPARGTGKGWLFGIARHQLDHARRAGQVQERARRRLAIETPPLGADAAAELDALAGGRPPDQRLQDALSSLPLEHRAAVHARVVQERSYEDIAAAQHADPALIRQRVSRGLAALRTRLGGEHLEP